MRTTLPVALLTLLIAGCQTPLLKPAPVPIDPAAVQLDAALQINLLPAGKVAKGHPFRSDSGGVDSGSASVFAVAFPPDTDRVIVFQREARRIDGLMAA